MKHAACIPHICEGRDPWHPDDEQPRRVQAVMYEQARVVCVACPVQVLCGRRGLVLLETDGVDGMYGGMTPDELRVVARTLGTADAEGRPGGLHGPATSRAAGTRLAGRRTRGTSRPAGRRKRSLPRQTPDHLLHVSDCPRFLRLTE